MSNYIHPSVTFRADMRWCDDNNENDIVYRVVAELNDKYGHKEDCKTCVYPVTMTLDQKIQMLKGIRFEVDTMLDNLYKERHEKLISKVRGVDNKSEGLHREELTPY